MLATCGGDDMTGPETIEDANFAASLGINLANMTRTASGLYYEDIEDGAGEPATAGDDVRVGYSGRLSDGTCSTAVNSPSYWGGSGRGGFDEGVTGMRVGGTRRILIPPALGYGNGAAGRCPPVPSWCSGSSCCRSGDGASRHVQPRFRGSREGGAYEPGAFPFDPQKSDT